ncbi:MAG: hypothetical protein ACRDOA_23445, partial [Streptosporangiaceae bacterium]
MASRQLATWLLSEAGLGRYRGQAKRRLARIRTAGERATSRQPPYLGRTVAWKPYGHRLEAVAIPRGR